MFINKYYPKAAIFGLLTGAFLSGMQARAESFGINFIGNTSDLVTGTAGVLPITNWNNVSGATFTSGSIQSSDGLISATLNLSGAVAAGSWHSGATSDGGNGSLMDGYIDPGANHSSGASVVSTISGLTGSSYSVYLYIYSDASHPGDGGQWLPNYSINGTSYFAPSLGNGATTWNSTSTSVGGAFTGFVKAKAYAANFNTATANPSDFGNYIQIDNVVPVSGVITIISETSSQSWRSPLNGIEIVGVPNSPNPSIPSISPTNSPVYAGTTVTLSETSTGQSPLFYQWRTDGGGGGGARTNIAGAVTTNLVVNTTGRAAGVYRYDVVVSNSVGVSTSSVAILNLAAASAPVLVSDVAPNPAIGYVGGSQTFSATFNGTPPIFYQWQANTGSGATNIPGATNASLTLANLQLTSAGTYRLLASNSVGGPVTTSAANLTVNTLPAFVSAVTQVNPIGYWRLNETNSTAGGNLNAVDMMGNYNGTYGSGAADGAAGPSSASGFSGLESFNTAAQFNSGNPNSFITLPALNLNTNTITISAWIYPIGTPADNSGLVFCRPNGDASGFNIKTGGQLGYTWNQNNGNTYNWLSGLVPPVQQWSFIALVISPDNAVIYLCNTNGIQFATNAVASTVEAFNDVTLIGADSLGGRIFNGIMDEVAIFNSSLSRDQVLQLFFNAASRIMTVSTPVISPTNNVFSGTTVTLTETAFGLAPLRYQWLTNGVALSGATNSVLSLTNTTTSASGNYSVRLSNSSTTNQSSAVSLTVNPPSAPFFMQQPSPVAVTNYAGGLVTFTALVNGTPPISLQWQHNGTNILNATTNTLSLGGLQLADSGNYALTASNSFSATNSLPASLTVLPLPNAGINVLTYHYNNTRQGQNTNEFLLTTANVTSANFGKLFSQPVDGYVYAQPLIMNGVNIPGKGIHNVVFVLTMHDSIYAFDADSNGGANGGLLWKTNVGVSSPSPTVEFGARYHPGVGNLDVVPEEGITGTPVIDPASGTLYLDAFTREVVAGVSTNYFHRIHALNITNGTEQPYSPVTVVASVPGKGVGGNGSVVTFSAIQHCQRPGMTLAGGILYVAYGSHDDTDPYHGWVLGYNATNLTLSTNYIYNTTPNATTSAFGANAGEGAIWMGGNGLSVDANTNLYFETGNGSFSQNTNGGDYSDSFVKLSTSNKLAVVDYFTPYNQLDLQNKDNDLGSGGPLLLPDAAGSSAHPHLIVGAGKEGRIYLVDRDNMGHYNGTDGINGTDSQIVHSTPKNTIGGVWSSPAYFNNRIYYQGNGDVMKAFLITNAVMSDTPESQSATSYGFPGATPTISANGANNGIAWSIQADAYLSSGPAILHAYNATNLALELYNSSQKLVRDNPGGAVKMVPPVIANGKVYVGAQYAVSVYGLGIFLPTPTISPAGGTFTNSVVVTLADATPSAAIYFTLDGTAPTASSSLYNGSFLLTSSALVKVIAIQTGAVNSAVASASFVNTAALGTGSGLVGQYFTNHSSASPFTGAPVLMQTNATINFNWGTGGPSPLVGATNFTVRWIGCVQPQYNETYNFITTADDGVRLYINGQLLINDWADKTAATSRTNSITLVAQQFYNLELDYYQKTNNASVSLAWSSPSTPQAIVPSVQLYPFTNPPPTVVMLSPTNNATNFTAAASVTVSAEADAPYNPINLVNFYANSTFVGGVSNAPYILTLTGLAPGNYALSAVAVDSSGLNSTSAPVNISVTSGSGQPYGLTANGTVPPFFNMPTTFNGPLPASLSQVGIFGNTASMTPTNGLISYTPNTPLWSDGALKTRYIAVPNNGGVITPDEQISFAATASWTFPAGTVFVKTFELNTDTTNPNVRRRLETRLLVRDVNGGVYGVTYKWRADNSDADLLTGSLLENILITNATGVSTQTWYYPSPADCLQCHTPVAKYVLGLNTRQLNGNQTYSATGVTDNQLRTLNRLGLFNPAFNESAITNFAKLSALTNLTASLQERARSYLDANCAQCHQPGGTGITFDARYDTAFTNQNISNYLAAVALGADNAKIIAPHDIWRSMIYQRMNTTNNTYKMPPLARALIDTNAVQVFADWINSLPGIPALAPPNITPNGGSYIASVNVTLQSPDTNATTFYTLDGSLPTTNSFRYSGPFNLLNNATLSVNAFEANYNNSVAVSAFFQVNPLHFTSQSFTNKWFQIGFYGAIGSNYVLQATTNFSTWTPISTNLAVTNFFNLFDVNATNYPYRFYRVQAQ